MSLITEALRLRSGERAAPGNGRTRFPPLRKRSPVFKLLLVVAGMGGLVVLGFWKGAEGLETLERLAGIPTHRADPVAALPAVPEAKAPVTSPAVTMAPVEAQVAEAATEPPATSADVRGAQARVAEAAAEPPAASADVRGAQAGMPEAAASPAPAKVGVGETLARTDNLIQRAAQSAPGAAGSRDQDLEPILINLALGVIEDEKQRQQMEEEQVERVQLFLRSLEVQGVCLQESESTAILNGELVRIGDTFGALGLKLKMIDNRRLVFADRSGKEFPKSY